MLSRQALLRLMFILVALGFCVYGVVSQWDEITSALGRMTWYALVGSLAAGVAGLFSMMLAWRALLGGFGSPLALRPATRTMFLGQLGKYVPGSVWALIGQTELARSYGVPRERGAAATLLAMATTLATGCAVAAVTLPLTSADATSHYWWLLLLAPIMLAALHPKIVQTALNMTLKLIRRPALTEPVAPRAMAVAIAWTLLGWLLFGVHTALLVSSAGATGHAALFPLSTGAYALAWCVGFLVIIAPGGLGAREAALVVTLSPVMGEGGPLVVALASRVIFTIADLGWALAGSYLGRGVPTVPVETVEPEPVPGQRP